MKRLVSSLLAPVSLLLCVTTAILWARGRTDLWSWAPSLGEDVTPEQVQKHMDQFGIAGAEVQWALSAERGRLILERSHYGDPALRGQAGRNVRHPMASGQRVFQAPVSGGGFVPGSVRWYAIPLWPVVLASAVPPAVAARAFLRRRQQRVRRERGLCPQCGYDLCASPGQCPECGTPVKPDNTVH